VWKDPQNRIGVGGCIIRPLNTMERVSLEQSLNWLADGFKLKRPIELSFLQSLYDDQLQDLIDGEEDDFEHMDQLLISLGLSWGFTFLYDGDFAWARLVDEHGEETVIASKTHHLSINPISMIERRLRDREVVDLAEVRYCTLEGARAVIQQNMAPARGDVLPDEF
jgi:hypothetical protein